MAEIPAIAPVPHVIVHREANSELSWCFSDCGPTCEVRTSSKTE